MKLSAVAVAAQQGATKRASELKDFARSTNQLGTIG
jgi:hypothetical protein